MVSMTKINASKRLTATANTGKAIRDALHGSSTSIIEAYTSFNKAFGFMSSNFEVAKYLKEAGQVTNCVTTVIERAAKSFKDGKVVVDRVNDNTITVPFATDRDAEKCMSWLVGAGGAKEVKHLVTFKFSDETTTSIQIEFKE